MARDYMLVLTTLSGWKIVPYTPLNRLQYGTNNFIGSYEDCEIELKNKQQ